MAGNGRTPECKERLTHGDAVRRAREAMPGEDALYGLGELYRLFGDSTRVKILCALRTGEMCVCDLQEILQMTQSAVSHQLRPLKQARLIKYRRAGKSVLYSLADDHVEGIIQMGMAHVLEAYVTGKAEENHHV